MTRAALLLALAACGPIDGMDATLAARCRSRLSWATSRQDSLKILGVSSEHTESASTLLCADLIRRPPDGIAVPAPLTTRSPR